MNRILFAVAIALLIGGCTSVKSYNRKLAEMKNPEKLRADIDYLNRTLQKYHPQLYWYISKSELDSKFDSLKKTINEPMTSRDFYYKVAPVVASIKEGHTRIAPLNRAFKSKERDSLKIEKFGSTPFSKLKFTISDNRLYVLKNNSWNTAVQPGSEVVSVNGIKSQHLLDKYRSTLTADGYINTFKDRMVANRFASFFYNDFDFTDSLSCELRYRDTLKTVVLKRRVPADTTKKKEVKVKEKKIPLTAAQKDSARCERKKRSYLGYDSNEKTYCKNLTFNGSDSSIAIMKLNDFTGGDYSKFYRNSFKKLDSLKTKTLIIDLRNNPGGRVTEINELYSYLMDTSFRFVQKSEITSVKSMLFTPYFHGTPILAKVFMLPFYPIYATYVLTQLSKGDDGNIYVKLGSKLQKTKKPKFKGNVYVLINGGSFSASCIISSNLKGTKRAVFVGEETGGAYNGTVAGLMPLFELPNSKLKARIGLMCIRPEHQTPEEGRGIIPDVAITPSLDDRLKGIDPELNWIISKERGAREMVMKKE